ncbi:MAG: RidA family protein [Rhodobacteraceae bacterium]|nr:RidA family protein [Paracoccaceae bacterium]
MSITRNHSSHRMSQLVIHNNTAYLAGQVADDTSDDVRRQTVDCLAKVDALLIEAGSDRDHILSVTIYVKDIGQFALMNEVWDAWIADHGKPARACVEAPMALPKFLVEICVIAAVKG